MSALPIALYRDPNTLVSPLSVNFSTLAGNVSTLTTQHIVLDGNSLDTVGVGSTATLLLNGQAIRGLDIRNPDLQVVEVRQIGRGVVLGEYGFGGGAFLLAE